MSVGILLSFHFWRDQPLTEMVADWSTRPLVFADSGAFSVANVGATIDLDDYAAWLTEHRDVIDVACTLDVVGDHVASAVNTARLHELGHDVIPVFHVGEPWAALERYCEEHRYVGLGGMVPWAASQRKVLRWLIASFQIGKKHGTVFHGLGQTTVRTLAALPFFSVDSSSWVSCERFGTLALWDDERGWVTLQPTHEPRRVAELASLIRAHGLDPATVGELTAQPLRKADADTIREASLHAWARMTEWWAGRHGPVACPGLPSGPHLFLMCLDERQFTTARLILDKGVRCPHCPRTRSTRQRSKPGSGSFSKGSVSKTRPK